MKFIIDGYNLMHRVKMKGETLERKREYLVGLINAFAALNEIKTVGIVFDAGKGGSSLRGRQSMGVTDLYFATQEETADDFIMDMIKKRKGKAKEYMIVSSDNKITRFAQENSMNTMSSDEFADYIQEEEEF
jgi:predicted RNA-binding protein with PIN domain